jgi:hypothetical protein
VGDGVKEMGREEGGGEVPVIDEGVGGDAAGSNRSYSTVFKLNRTKWGKLKEGNII